MIKSFEDRVRENTKIQLTDLFGKGRIRKQMWEYNALKNNKNREIERLQIIAASQSKAVNAMVVRAEQLEKENVMLRKCIKEGDEARKSMAKKLSMSEARLAELEQDYLVLKNKESELCMEEVS